MKESLTINIRGRLMDFRRPKVMGIVNVTPDSFYAGSRTSDRESIRDRVRRFVEEGVDILDLGGMSSRPGAADVDAGEEYSRLALALEVVRDEAPEIPVSVDTFRSEVARRCVEEWRVDIINDIAGGTLDPEMWHVVADLKVAYVLMHMRGTPATMQTMTDYSDVTAEIIADLSRKVMELRGLGVCDIIIDPGFGFAKTVEQNFRILSEIGEFCKMGMPVLAGISRKTMIWKTLGVTPDDSLWGSVALNAIAMNNGADIVRVHDVRPAADSARLVGALRQNAIR